MKNLCIFLLALACTGAAQAQYRWLDKDGKTRYGDTPPPGVKATVLGAPAAGSAPSVPAAASASAKKGPLSAAEKEQDYRKRQEAAKKNQEKSDQERQLQAEKADNCARVREYQRTLESGQRIARTSAAGERYYLDESQTAQELAVAKQTASQACAN